jgi:hypothetical protein
MERRGLNAKKDNFTRSWRVVNGGGRSMTIQALWGLPGCDLMRYGAISRTNVNSQPLLRVHFPMQNADDMQDDTSVPKVGDM